jgi:hypothetical protein
LTLKIPFDLSSTVRIEPIIDIGLKVVGRDRAFHRGDSILCRRIRTPAGMLQDMIADADIPEPATNPRQTRENERP